MSDRPRLSQEGIQRAKERVRAKLQGGEDLRRRLTVWWQAVAEIEPDPSLTFQEMLDVLSHHFTTLFHPEKSEQEQFVEEYWKALHDFADKYVKDALFTNDAYLRMRLGSDYQDARADADSINNRFFGGQLGP